MYEEIIDSINSEQLQEFTREAVGIFPSCYRNMAIPVADGKKEYLEQYTQDLHRVVSTLLEEIDADDIVYDIFTVAVILQFAGRFEVVNGEVIENTLYPFEVRSMFRSLESTLGRDMYNEVMMVVESHIGLKSPIPQVMPQISDPVYAWILPLANAIVRTHNI